MGKEFIHGKMAENMKEIISMIKNMVMGYIYGQIRGNMKGIGNMESSMGKDSMC